jgi:hypothetical protein
LGARASARDVSLGREFIEEDVCGVASGRSNRPANTLLAPIERFRLWRIEIHATVLVGLEVGIVEYGFQGFPLLSAITLVSWLNGTMRKHRSHQCQNRPLQDLLHPGSAVAAFSVRSKEMVTTSAVLSRSRLATSHR